MADAPHRFLFSGRPNLGTIFKVLGILAICTVLLSWTWLPSPQPQAPVFIDTTHYEEAVLPNDLEARTHQRFGDLLDQEKLFYQETRPHPFKDVNGSNFSFVFRIAPQLLDALPLSPILPVPKNSTEQPKVIPERELRFDTSFLEPESDYVIAELSGTHRLILPRTTLYHPSLVLATIPWDPVSEPDVLENPATAPTSDAEPISDTASPPPEALPSSDLPPSAPPPLEAPPSTSTSSEAPSTAPPPSEAPPPELPQAAAVPADVPPAAPPSSEPPSSEAPPTAPPPSEAPPPELPPAEAPPSELPPIEASSAPPPSDAPPPELPPSNPATDPPPNPPSGGATDAPPALEPPASPPADVAPPNSPPADSPPIDSPELVPPPPEAPPVELPSAESPPVDLPASDLPSENAPPADLPSADLAAADPPPADLPESRLLPADAAPAELAPTDLPPPPDLPVVEAASEPPAVAANADTPTDPVVPRWSAKFRRQENSISEVDLPATDLAATETNSTEVAPPAVIRPPSNDDDLTPTDLAVAWSLIRSFRDSKLIVTYDCGINAGAFTSASPLLERAGLTVPGIKYLEAFPSPDSSLGHLLWPALAPPAADPRDPPEKKPVARAIPEVPFEHLVLRYHQTAPLAVIVRTHRRLLALLRHMQEDAEVMSPDYNVIMTSEWMAMVPRRRRAPLSRTGVKAEGENGPWRASAQEMLGLVSVRDVLELERWRDLGYGEYLKLLGIPRDGY